MAFQKAVMHKRYACLPFGERLCSPNGPHFCGLHVVRKKLEREIVSIADFAHPMETTTTKWGHHRLSQNKKNFGEIGNHTHYTTHTQRTPRTSTISLLQSLEAAKMTWTTPTSLVLHMGIFYEVRALKKLKTAPGKSALLPHNPFIHSSSLRTQSIENSSYGNQQDYLGEAGLQFLQKTSDLIVVLTPSDFTNDSHLKASAGKVLTAFR